jgi:hypothetical protein
MTATAEKQQEQERAIEALRSYMPRKTIVYTRTDYTRGQTDYVRVYVVSSGEIVDSFRSTSRREQCARAEPASVRRLQRMGASVESSVLVRIP